MCWVKDLWNRSWFGSGGEEENVQYFHNPLMEPFPCWRALPVLAQCEILEFTLNNLRRVANYERYLVEERFGFHVVVPARNWSSRFLQPEQKVICDSTVKKVIDGMAGKLIRGLELIDMPPQAVPGETASALVQRLISFPRILFHLNLSYVDVDVIHAFLYQCGNLRSLNYQTSFYRPIPTGPISRILLGAAFTPARIPAVGETLVQKLPAQILHLPNLTTLTLKLRQASDRLQSDWANPLYILLAVTPPNLKTFKFCLDLTDFWMDYRVTGLIRSIIAEFLSKVRGSLTNFEFASTDTPDDIRVNAYINGLHSNKALPVLSQLVTGFGSRGLQNVYQAVEVGDWGQLWSISEDFIKQIASELRCLSKVKIKSRVKDLPLGHFRGFLKKIPAITQLTLHDDYVGLPPETYDLFMPPRTPPFGISSWATLEKLSVVRTNGVLPRFALHRLLECLSNVRELEQYRTGKETFQEDDNFSRAVVKAGRVEVTSGRKSIQLPDVTIQVQPPVDRAMFERLRVLKLQGFHLFARDVRKFIICRNLEKLHLEIPPGLNHSFFGVESADLLELMATLRKLNYIKVSQVQFPQGRNNSVAQRQRSALIGIGTLVENCFCVE